MAGRAKITRRRMGLELKRSRRYLIPIAFLVVAMLVGTGVIFRNLSYERPWQGYTHIDASFANVEGVTPGTQEVRLAGIPVGVIKASRLVDGEPTLTLSVDDEYAPIYRDAQLALRPTTPLDDMYVAIISRGTPAAGELEEGEILAGGRTRSPVDISRVLNTFDAGTRDRMGHLLDALGKGLPDGGQQLRAAFTQAAPFLRVTERFSRTLAAREERLRRLVHSLASVSDAVGRRDSQLAGLVSNGNATVAELAENDQALGETISALRPVVGTVRTSFARVRALQSDLDPALESLFPVANELRPGLEALARFSDDAEPALEALDPAAQKLRPLARALRPTADSIAGGFSELSPQAPGIDRVTASVVKCLDAIQNFNNNTISIAKYYDAHGVIPRSETTFGVESLGGAGSAGPEPGLRQQPMCVGDPDAGSGGGK